MPMDAWNTCSDPVDESALLGRLCFGALDLSSPVDMSAFALVFPPENDGGQYQVIMRYYMPADNIDEKSKRDNTPYDMWVRSGKITPTPGNVIDYQYIRRDIKKAASKYGLQGVAYDPWGAVQLANQLQDNDGIAMAEHRQGFIAMNNPMKELLKLVVSKKLAHGGHPVLKWNAENIIVKIDPAENIKPEKTKSPGRIDGLVALVMALGLSLEYRRNS